MANTDSGARNSTTSIILIPTVITLLITLLRVYGELHHWPKPWFSNQPGGGGAVIGISWLPFIFGPYFALKLSGAGSGPRSTGKSIIFGLVCLVLVIGGAVLAFAPPFSAVRLIGGLLLMVIAAVLPFNAWPALAKTLVMYGLAARIPVIIVMYMAIQGNWGTHYDAVPPTYAGPTSPVSKWFAIGVLPQIFLWIGFTVAVGMLVGASVNAIVRRKAATQTESFQH
jgi:hypothetical protein